MYLNMPRLKTAMDEIQEAPAMIRCDTLYDTTRCDTMIYFSSSEALHKPGVNWNVLRRFEGGGGQLSQGSRGYRECHFYVSPYPADHDYCRFWSVLFVDQITVIGNEMCVWTSRFANNCAEIKQVWVIFCHLELWVAVARHNFKWVKI